jgi:hypothetical protein
MLALERRRGGREFNGKASTAKRHQRNAALALEEDGVRSAVRD